VSKFDEAQFRELAKAQGYSDEEIDKELKGVAAPAGAAVPTSVPIPGAADITQQFDQEAQLAQDKIKKDINQTKQENISGSNFDWQGVLTSPAALVTGGALLGYLSNKAVPAVYKSIKNRSIKSAPDVSARVEPVFDAPVIIQTPPGLPETPVIDKVKAAKDLVDANRQAGLGVPPPQAGPTPQAAPVAPQAPAPQAGPAPVAPPPTAGISETLASGGDVKQAIQQTIAQEIDKPLMTGTGKPAFAGTGPAAQISAKTGKPKFSPEYATMADVPSDYALVPGGQYIDPLRQDLGQGAYTQAFTGRDFPGTYEQAQAMGKEINRDLGRPTREAAKAAGLPPAEITPGITKMTSSGKKGVSVKSLGLAGALVAISDLAKADTKQQKTDAMNGLLGAILPPGMDIGDAGAGSTVTPQKLQNVSKLGSPLGQTEFAKRLRAEEEMIRKINGRTGSAVPPQYRR